MPSPDRRFPEAPAIIHEKRALDLPGLIRGSADVVSAYEQARARMIRNGLLGPYGNPAMEGDKPFWSLDEAVALTERLTDKQREMLCDSRVVQMLGANIGARVNGHRRLAAHNVYKPMPRQMNADVSTYTKSRIIPRADRRNGLIVVNDGVETVRPNITGWTLGFGEVRPALSNLLPDENIDWSLAERINAHKNRWGGTDGAQGMDLATYVDLMDDSLEFRMPIDDYRNFMHWTLLDAEYEKGEEFVVGADWGWDHRQRMVFHVDYADGRSRGARPRPWVRVSQQA